MSDDRPKSQGDEDSPLEETPAEDSSKPDLLAAEKRRLLKRSSSRPSDDEPAESTELGGRMGFLEHLDELRRRIIWSAIAVAVTFAASFVLREPIFTFFEKPIKDVLLRRGIEELVITRATEAFTIYLKVSLTAAIFFAAPILAYQVWLFIAPGLYRREKRFALPFLFCSTVLFLSGGALAYFLILPAGLQFLVNEMGARFRPVLSAVDYFNFALIILVGMGIVFQMPVLVAFLSIFGLITPRFLWRNFRYAFLIIVIVAAIASPTPDALNLFFWVAPMVILYLISIAVSWIFQRRRRKRLEAEA